MRLLLPVGSGDREMLEAYAAIVEISPSEAQTLLRRYEQMRAITQEDPEFIAGFFDSPPIVFLSESALESLSGHYDEYTFSAFEAQIIDVPLSQAELVDVACDLVVCGRPDVRNPVYWEGSEAGFACSTAGLSVPMLKALARGRRYVDKATQNGRKKRCG